MIKNQKLMKEIAEARIKRLFELAKDRTLANGAHDTLAKRYIVIAQKMSSHYKVGKGNELRRQVCKKCGSVLVPGMNCTVRLVSGKGYYAVTCECGEEKHVFYKE